MHHARVLRPAEGLYAFYDGRIEGYRFAEGPNWVDEGALGVGIASYAVVSGGRALVYDTHTSIEHARFVREALEEEGVETFTVVLSHWHLDHVAGTEVFRDCEVIASERTAELLERNAGAIARGEVEGPPPIEPLILPTRTYSDRLALEVGETRLELIHVNIHSDDATVLWLPEQRVLLCGDTMEDTITYVDEPGAFDEHLRDLGELRRLEPERILPNHGDPEVIAGGGYSAGLISATEQYIGVLRRLPEEPDLRELSLREVVAGPLEEGWINYFEPYEEVHRENVATVLASAESRQLRRMRGGFQAWNDGDYEKSLAFARPDVVWRVEPFFPDMEPVYEGHAGLRRFYRTFNEAWEDNSLEIVRVVDERPGQIYVEIRFWARARDGLEFEAPFHQIYRYDDEDQLREFHGFVDEAKARSEAGLDDG
jgi:glyoxylase-like metal-dependent hydrolase (beta-lactamase superfamily II)/ketosteroid isomerase-like protein